MSRLLCFLLIIYFNTVAAKHLDISVNAESAILINADTGVVLYEKNAHNPEYPASITKVGTALYALHLKGNQLDAMVTAEQESVASISEAAIMRSKYTLPSYWVEQGSSHIGIKKGEELSFRDLLYGMLVPSANDAANVVAQHVSGTIPDFVSGMNAYLKQIGCLHTTFHNPHGLHHPDHKTTAYDMALMTKRALKNPAFCEIVSTVRCVRPKTNKQESSTMVQTNKLIRTGRFFYPKAIGVKTGSTSPALNTFIGAARHEGRTLIAVLLKTKERSDIFTDSVKLFEEAFNEPKIKRTLVQTGLQSYILNPEGSQKPIMTYAVEDVVVEYYPAEEPVLKSYLTWDEVTFPVIKDQRVGEITIKTQTSALIKTIPLFAVEEVPSTWNFWIKSIF